MKREFASQIQSEGNCCIDVNYFVNEVKTECSKFPLVFRNTNQKVKNKKYSKIADRIVDTEFKIGSGDELRCKQIQQLLRANRIC